MEYKINGVGAYEKTMTFDGRWVAEIDFRETPIPLLSVLHVKDKEAHYGSEIIGRIDKIWKESGVVLLNATVTDRKAARYIKKHKGEVYFEADMDDVNFFDIEDNVIVSFAGRIAAMTLGERPCWDGLEVREGWV